MKQENNVLIKSIFNVSFLLALITGFLYLMGIAYYDGYMRAIGFDFTCIPISLETTLTYGFLTLLTPIFEIAISGLLIITAGILIIHILKTLIKSKKFNEIMVKIGKKLSSLLSSSEDQGNLSIIQNKLEKLLEIISTTLFCFLVFFFIALYAQNAGKKAADLQVKYMNDNPGSTKLKLKKNNAIYKGYLVKSSESKILFYSNKTFNIFQIQDVEYIKYQK